jgi:hypothetical protein
MLRMTVFWDVAPCSLAEIDQRDRDAYCLHRNGDWDGGSKCLCNVVSFIPDYTAQHPRRHTSSYSPRRENLKSYLEES